MTVQFTENDLVLRVTEGNETGRLYSVSTEKCLIGLSEGQSQSHLAIFRGPNGTAIQGVGGEVVVNGEAAESQWLNDGDQIEFANTRFEVVQLGQLEFKPSGGGSGTEATSRDSETANPEATEPAEYAEPAENTPQAEPGYPETSESEPGDLEAFSSRMESLSQRLNNLTCSIDNNATIPEADLAAALGQGREEQLVDEVNVDGEAANTQAESALDSFASDSSESSEFSPQYEVEETIETYSESDDLASRLESAMNISSTEDELGQPEESFASTGLAALETTEEETFVGLENVLADAEPSVDEPPTEQEGANLGSQAPSIVENRLRDAFAQHQEEISSNQPTTEKEPEKMPANNESVADLLARMQSEGQLDYEVPGEDSISTTSTLEPTQSTPPSFEPTPSPTPQPTPQPQPIASTDDEDDGSVEDYMNRLLGRMRGGEGSDPPKPQSKKEQVSEAPVQTFEAPEPKEVVEPVKLLSPEEFKPSMSAPEKNRNLDAMRELANQNSRAALKKANKQRATAVAVTNFSIMGLGFALSIYLLMFSSGFTSSFFLMGAITLGLSLGLGYLGSKSLMSVIKDS